LTDFQNSFTSTCCSNIQQSHY